MLLRIIVILPPKINIFQLIVLIFVRTIFVIILLLLYGSTNVWTPRVKLKSFGWAANRNQPQHRLKFVVTITQ